MERIKKYYRILFDEISKPRYKIHTVRDYYFGNTKSDDKTNVVLRIDVDAGFLPAFWISEYLNKIKINASFYYLTRTATYPLDWDILRKMRDNGFEIGIHSAHYEEQLKTEVDGIHLIRQDAKKFEKELGQKVGMVWHGDNVVKFYKHGNWELYQDVNARDLGLAYHDGINSKYISKKFILDSPTGWEPPADLWLSDSYDCLNYKWKDYIKQLTVLKNGSTVEIMLHPFLAFKWWKLELPYESFPSKKITNKKSILRIIKYKIKNALKKYE